MAEAHDENSINTDITFESGDENVCNSKNFKYKINLAKYMSFVLFVSRHSYVGNLFLLTYSRLNKQSVFQLILEPVQNA